MGVATSHSIGGGVSFVTGKKCRQEEVTLSAPALEAGFTRFDPVSGLLWRIIIGWCQWLSD